jgi:hypothetical protein
LRSLLRRNGRSQNTLQNRTKADGEQGLLGIPQEIDDAAFGVAEKNALTIGEQMQTIPARDEIGETMTELATQQGCQFADALQTESTTTQIAEYGEFS